MFKFCSDGLLIKPRLFYYKILIFHRKRILSFRSVFEQKSTLCIVAEEEAEKEEDEAFFALEQKFDVLNETAIRYDAANFGRNDKQKAEMDEAREGNDKEHIKRLEKRFQNHKINCQIMFDMVVQAPRSKNNSKSSSENSGGRRRRSKPWHKFVDTHIMCLISNKVREMILVNRRKVFDPDSRDSGNQRPAVIPVGHHYTVIEIDPEIQPALNMIINWAHGKESTLRCTKKGFESLAVCAWALQMRHIKECLKEIAFGLKIHFISKIDEEDKNNIENVHGFDTVVKETDILAESRKYGKITLKSELGRTPPGVHGGTARGSRNTGNSGDGRKNEKMYRDENHSDSKSKGGRWNDVPSSQRVKKL